MGHTRSWETGDPKVDGYVGELITRAAEARLPQLFSDTRDAIYRLERNGVTVLAVPTPALSEAELKGIMAYRLAQYLVVHFVDARMIYEAQMEHEPIAKVAPNDIHFLAGSTETGEILCYATLEGGPEFQPGATLRTLDRPLFPAEQVHGWGIFNHLMILPDLPLNRIRELGRFVKNQRLHTFDLLGIRGPVEIGVALFKTLAGPLRMEVEALVGDLEEGVARQNLDFFHVPLVVIHGTVPYEADASYFFPRYQYSTVFPFAHLAADAGQDMSMRLAHVEEALALEGKKALLGLLMLKQEKYEPARSSLEPASGLNALDAADVRQLDVAMHKRREMLTVGEELRHTQLFETLSVAEATVLATFMEPQHVQAGEIIVHQGHEPDGVFVIEQGVIEIRASSRSGHTRRLAVLRSGEYFGEIGLVTGMRRTANVIAETDSRLLKLSKESYIRYLASDKEVTGQLNETAAARLAALLQAQ
jgi:cyclic nucleotide-binding protein